MIATAPDPADPIQALLAHIAKGDKMAWLKLAPRVADAMHALALRELELALRQVPAGTTARPRSKRLIEGRPDVWLTVGFSENAATLGTAGHKPEAKPPGITV